MHIVSTDFKPLWSGSHHIPIRLTSKCLDRSLRCWDILEDITTTEGVGAIDSDSILSAVETNGDDRSQSNQSRIGVVVITQLIFGADVNSVGARHPSNTTFCWEFGCFQSILNRVDRRVNNKFRSFTVVIQATIQTQLIGVVSIPTRIFSQLIQDRLDILTHASSCIYQMCARHILECDKVALTIKPVLDQSKSTCVTASDHVISDCLNNISTEVHRHVGATVVCQSLIIRSLCDSILIKEDHVGNSLVGIETSTKSI